jgi:hypothetical protein
MAFSVRIDSITPNFFSLSACMAGIYGRSGPEGVKTKMVVGRKLRSISRVVPTSRLPRGPHAEYRFAVTSISLTLLYLLELGIGSNTKSNVSKKMRSRALDAPKSARLWVRYQ